MISGRNRSVPDEDAVHGLVEAFASRRKELHATFFPYISAA